MGVTTYCSQSSGLPLVQAHLYQPAFLLDIDGTLAHTDGTYRKVFIDMLTSYGYNVTEEFYAQHVHGRTDKDVFTSLLPPGSSSAEVDAAGREKDNRFCELARQPGNIALIDGLQNLVHFASRHRIPCIPVTNAPRGAAETVLAILCESVQGFEDVVACADVVIGAECDNAKPYPDPYLEGARRLGVPIGGCVAFEDSRTGIRSAVSAGCLGCIGVTSNMGSAEMIKAGCSATMKTWLDLTPTFLYEHLVDGPKTIETVPRVLASIDHIREGLKRMAVLASAPPETADQPANLKPGPSRVQAQGSESKSHSWLDESDSKSHQSVDRAEKKKTQADIIGTLQDEVRRLRHENGTLQKKMDAVQSAMGFMPLTTAVTEHTPIITVVPVAGARSGGRVLLKMMGKEMIVWVLESINANFDADDEVLVVYDPATTDGDELRRVLHSKVDHRIRVAELRTSTSGAAETVLLGLQHYIRSKLWTRGDHELAADNLCNPNFYKELTGIPVVSWDGDLIYHGHDVLNEYRRSLQGSDGSTGGTWVFKREAPDKGRYSYCQMDSTGRKLTKCVDARVSAWANTGTYAFPDGENFCMALVKGVQTKPSTQLCEVVDSMISDNGVMETKFNMHEIEPTSFHCISTPAKSSKILS